MKQECIPVGCVPPPAVAVHGGGGVTSVHSGIHNPPIPPSGCGPGDHTGCGPGDPPPPGCGPGDPLARPLNFPPPPPGVGLETPLETCKACWDTTPPRRPAARHAGIPPAMHAGIPPPCEQNDRQVQKYYLAPNFVCGR